MKGKLFKEVGSVVVVVTFMSFSTVLLSPVKKYYSEYPISAIVICLGMILAIYGILKYFKKL